MHTHRHEDEYTYVLEGEIGVQVGDEVRVARPGDLVFKPRGVPHAFWNAGDVPARALEMDMASIPTLAERHGLVTGEPPA